MKYMIIYYGKDPKPPKLYYSSDMQEMLEEVVRLTKLKALFAVYEVGKCVGDFS